MSREKINSCEKKKFLFKIILIIIIIIIILSFTTEILFTTISPFTTSNSDTTTTPAPTTTPVTVLPSPFNYSEEKFLTYLPHNGFHQQHGALMNAIMLSYMTNRTLIIPPILINYFPRTSTFHSLSDTLNKIIEVKKYREEHCYRDEKEFEETIFYCDYNYSKYDDFTMINWDQLFDLNELRKHVKMINRGYDFSLDNLKYNFNISENDLLIENISEFFDNDKKLINNDKKLIHFSSLFGPDKINLERRDNIKFRQLIHNKLIINDPKILNITDKIMKKLGGERNFIGLHIRIRGSFFKTRAEYNLNLIYNKLMKHLLELDLSKNSKNFLDYNLEECLKFNLPIIYIATDSVEPRNQFSKFYKNIPCVFTLFDFTKDIEIFLGKYGKLTSDFDENIDITNFYIPIIDLLISAHGNYFIGTQKSIFSEMANEANNIYNGRNAI
jgi:hypothetical protein